jgi:hypothetical protein
MSVTAAVLALTSAVAGAPPAHATTLGGKWPFNGQSLYLYYDYGGNHRYLGNVYQGGVNWTNTPTKVWVQRWPGVPYALQINVQDVYLSDTWWGITYLDPCNGCTYTFATIKLNQRTMDPLNDFMRTKVATHEFGHALGLAHPSGTATSVMNQGTLSYNTPRQYDINDVNGLYP